jgi:hypothetical protein
MKVYEESKYCSKHSSALYGVEWLSSRLRRVSSMETASTHWIGGWMDPRAYLEAVKKRTSLATGWNRTMIYRLYKS